MRNQNQRSRIFEQTLLQDFQCGNIQIVGRFVQQQNVSRLQHELSDQNAGALSSGKPANALIQVFTRKQKSFRPRSDVNNAILINHRVAVRRERPAQGNVRIKLAVLVKVHDSQTFGAAHLAGFRFDISAHQAKQSRLAAAVWTDQAYAHS